MNESPSTWVRSAGVTIPGNLLGATLTFFYFRFIHQGVLTYALVGDAVNLASRIQGLNKELGTDILLSDATRRRLTSEARLEALSAVRVKGKSVEVSVHRVV